MIIKKVLFSAGNSGFFFDDQKAIKSGAVSDGFFYTGEPVTPGFSAIRQPGEAVSVMIILEDGSAAIGDCAAVQYSGAGGRDPLFLAEPYLEMLNTAIPPLLEGRELKTFRKESIFFDSLEINGRKLHTAVRYGLTQALLEARALADRVPKAEVICREWNLPVIPEKVSLFGQSGDDRYTAVDKMILKGVEALPHALINNIENKLGQKGEKLLEYVKWLKERIETYGKGQKPDLHIDVYGTIGSAFNYDIKEIAGYISILGKAAFPFQLYIEGPVDMGERELQIKTLKKIKDELDRTQSNVKIVADEWCNTMEDIKAFADAGCCHMAQIKTPDLGGIHNIVDSILYCKSKRVEAYQGGTCNETDISARACVHIALAARPERVLVKPGMGFDEGLTIVRNEINRTVEWMKYRQEGANDE